jgi:hypothetical protein
MECGCFRSLCAASVHLVDAVFDRGIRLLPDPRRPDVGGRSVLVNTRSARWTHTTAPNAFADGPTVSGIRIQQWLAERGTYEDHIEILDITAYERVPRPSLREVHNKQCGRV